MRIWALAEYIYGHPGVTRSVLAHRFSVSERQVQSDMTLMRKDLALPLNRSHGYHLGAGAVDQATLSMRDISTLFQVIDRALRDQSISRKELNATVGRLVEAFPPHLQQLARGTLSPEAAVDGRPASPLLASLVTALVERQPVKLRFASSPGPGHPIESILKPEVLLPYQGDWYVVGWFEAHKRYVMLVLNGLRTVTAELPV